MKKKEFLIIFVLAVLVMGLSLLVKREPLVGADIWVVEKGWPVKFLILTIYGESWPPGATLIRPYLLGVFLDLLFWFLVLAAGWWIVKKLNKTLNLKNNLPVKLLILLLIVTFVIGGAVVYKRKNPLIPSAIPTPTSYKAYPSIFNFNFYPIHEIKKQRFGPGSYNTEGYVVKIFTCPPCPSGALCKPCMGENIVISENNSILTDYSSLTDRELTVFTQNPKQFQLGKKYQFSIRIVKDKRMTFEPINDIELVGYQEAIEESCHELESQIATLLDQANYCQKDSDCKLADIPSLRCPFGCYNFVNKSENLSLIIEGAEKYLKNCNPCIYRCAAAPKPEEIVCQNNKCLDIRFVTK